MASKEKAREMQAKDSPEAKAEPNREKKQTTKAFSKGIIPDYWLCFTGKVCLKCSYVQILENSRKWVGVIIRLSTMNDSNVSLILG